MIKTIEWTDEGIRMLDQRLLPTEEKYLMLRSYEEVAEAIKKMVVRGAPAIGVSAAMGLALGASQSVGTSVADLEDDFDYMCKVMSETRPTAVNLFWAIERMRERLRREKSLTKDPLEIKERLVEEALNIFREDIEANRALGRFGAELLSDGDTVLTHCNAGALATAGDYGTALGVVRGAIDAPGAKVDGLGIGKRQHSGHCNYRQYGRTRDEKRQDQCGRGGRGSNRREWGCREQDRDLHGCCSGR